MSASRSQKSVRVSLCHRECASCRTPLPNPPREGRGNPSVIASLTAPALPRVQIADLPDARQAPGVSSSSTVIARPRSSTPRPLRLNSSVSGILDHPHARVMTPNILSQGRQLRVGCASLPTRYPRSFTRWNDPSEIGRLIIGRVRNDNNGERGQQRFATGETIRFAEFVQPEKGSRP